MLTLKPSVAAAALIGTAIVSAGTGYFVSRITMTTRVAMSCPQPASTTGPQSKSFPPLGILPPTTGGKQF